MLNTLIWNYTGNAQRERRFNLSNVWKENVNKILSPQSESWNNNFWITIDLKKAMVNHLDEISWIFFIVNRTKTLSMFRIMRTSHEKKVWKFCINWYGYNNFTPHLLKKLMIFLIKSVLHCYKSFFRTSRESVENHKSKRLRSETRQGQLIGSLRFLFLKTMFEYIINANDRYHRLKIHLGRKINNIINIRNIILLILISNIANFSLI